MASLGNWINVSYITRLVRRFTLQQTPLSNAPVWMPYTVLPVTQADKLLKLSLSDQANGDLTGAAGTYVAYFTVPDNKRWTLKAVRKDPTTAATMVYIKLGTTGRAYDGLGTAAETVDGRDIELNEGDSVGLSATGNGADGAIPCRIFYEEENAF